MRTKETTKKPKYSIQIKTKASQSVKAAKAVAATIANAFREPWRDAAPLFPEPVELGEGVELLVVEPELAPDPFPLPELEPEPAVDELLLLPPPVLEPELDWVDVVEPDGDVTPVNSGDVGGAATAFEGSTREPVPHAIPAVVFVGGTMSFPLLIENRPVHSGLSPLRTALLVN